MNAARLKENLQAKDFIAYLKSGAVVKGIVRSVEDSANITWIAIEFPGIEERQIQVKDAGHLRLGDIVSLQCVPDLLRPEHYLFQVVSAPTQPGWSKPWTLWRRHVVQLRHANG